MRAKIDEDPSAYTLYRLDQLRKRYCCELKLTDVVLVLIRLEMATSFVIEWLIPSAFVPQLISSARNLDVGFYLNEHIVLITVNEEQIFLQLPDNHYDSSTLHAFHFLLLQGVYYILCILTISTWHNHIEIHNYHRTGLIVWFNYRIVRSIIESNNSSNTIIII